MYGKYDDESGYPDEDDPDDEEGQAWKAEKQEANERLIEIAGKVADAYVSAGDTASEQAYRALVDETVRMG